MGGLRVAVGMGWRVVDHCVASGSGVLCPALPIGQLGAASFGVHLSGCQRIAAVLGNERPVRPNGVVTLAEALEKPRLGGGR